jgi:hypothetical protein
VESPTIFVRELKMKRFFTVMLVLTSFIVAGSVFASGGKNQGTTGSGSTNTGTTSQGAGTQDRTGR